LPGYELSSSSVNSASKTGISAVLPGYPMGRADDADLVTIKITMGLQFSLSINPPVKRAQFGGSTGIVRQNGRSTGRPGYKAVVLACAGRTFIGGADIREFDLRWVGRVSLNQ